MYKICPECREEFRRDFDTCSDCGVPLAFPNDVPPEPTGDERPSLEILTKGGPRELEAFAQYLLANGVPSQIDTDPPSDGAESKARETSTGFRGHSTELALYVRLEDLAQANELGESYVRRQLPDFDGAAVEGEILESCPACGTPLAQGAEACGECGLEFAVQTIRCLRCGQESTSDQAACPNCGDRWDQA